jgi:two-component sensor histidine kinase
MTDPQAEEGGSPRRRGTFFIVAFYAILGSLAALLILSYLDNLKLSAMVDIEQKAYERNIAEQSSSLNRVVFAFDRLLVDSATRQGPDRLAHILELGQGAINHARIPQIIEASFLREVLGNDPLYLAERAEKSNARYREEVERLGLLLEMASDRGETREGSAALGEFLKAATRFMDDLQDRSHLFIQIEGSYVAENRRRISLLHSRISGNLVEFSLITVLLLAASILFFRSRFTLERELRAHRENLSALVAARTDELGATNERLRAALAEREVLIKEVYHRVKNNLAMVAGLISLQRDETTPENLDEAFEKLGQRLGAISLIHERLYRSADLSNIGFADYVTELCNTLIYSLSANPAAISFELDASEVRFSADTLIPLGLIITELVTNSLKYAFKERARGSIRVSLRDSQGGYLLEVKDDGKPPGDKARILEGSSLGTRLVAGLVLQIGGELQVELEGGTGIQIRFPRS